MSEKKIPYWALDKEEMFVFVDYEGCFSATDCINLEENYCAYIRKDLSIPKKELEELIERYSQTIDGATVIPHENFFFIISELRKLLEER